MSTMWWCVLALGYLHLEAMSLVGAHPLTSTGVETTEWGMQPPRPPPVDVPIPEPDTLHYRFQRMQFLDRAPEDDLNGPTAEEIATDLVGNYPYAPAADGVAGTATKRAFTLLSRWHPFSTLSRDAPSIREHNRQMFNDLDIETRAMLRPVGQPLRWG